mmetsp:Transcript_117870/g.375782  ORF Transcript_117870/g.375782 Transcript_117870/m.375782 type:complete len:264 (+) Transcript_117870:1346-2137(+)
MLRLAFGKPFANNHSCTTAARLFASRSLPILVPTSSILRVCRMKKVATTVCSAAMPLSARLSSPETKRTNISKCRSGFSVLTQGTSDASTSASLGGGTAASGGFEMDNKDTGVLENSGEGGGRSVMGGGGGSCCERGGEDGHGSSIGTGAGSLCCTRFKLSGCSVSDTFWAGDSVEEGRGAWRSSAAVGTSECGVELGGFESEALAATSIGSNLSRFTARRLNGGSCKSPPKGGLASGLHADSKALTTTFADHTNKAAVARLA